MAQSPFFLFKDPSKVQFSGSTSLTGNQLRGFGGFDPRISIGGSHTAGTGQYTPAGTALRDVFFDGTRVGSTSDRNVFEAPSDQGFSLYSGSTGANSQYQPISRNEVSNDTGMAGVGGPDSPALTIDPRTGRPISSSSTTVTALPGGDDALSTDNTTLTTFQPTNDIFAHVNNPAVKTFINRNFPAEFSSQNARVAFRNLAGDPVARILINGGTPSPEQMAEFRTKFVSEMERLGETATGIVNVLTGGGGSGVLDFFGNRGSTPRFSPEQTLDNLFAELGNTGLTIGPGAGQISLPDILGALGNIGLTIGEGAGQISLPDILGALGNIGLSIGEGAGQISLPDILSALNIPGLSSDISSGILGGLGGLDEDILKGLDIPGLTSGINAGIQGGITPLTGEDFGIPAIRESLFGEDGLESLIGDLNLDDLASAIGLQGSRISGAGGLSQQLGNLGFNQGFLKTLGTTEDTLGGLTRDLDELGRSEIPGQLNTSLLASQGVLDDILGGSFGGQGSGFPLQQTGLAKALGQGGDLKSLLEGISAPDFTSPLRQAGEINDLFSLGGDLQTNIGAAADRVGPLQQLLQQSGTFGGIADDIERGAGFADPLNQLAASAQSGAFGDIPRILQEAGVNVSGLGVDAMRDILGLVDDQTLSGMFDTRLGDRLGLVDDQTLSGMFDTRLAGLGTDMSAGFEGINFPDISGLNRIEQQFGNLTGLPASIEKLGQNLPEELRKVIEGEGGFRRGGGGGTTDLTGVNDQLKAILAQLGALDGIQPSGAGGVFEELLQSIRPGFTDIRSQIQKTTADLIAQGASPEDAQRRASEILSSDPVTASILADQERQNELREKEDRELLSRFGVLRGGGTIDLANLRAEDQSRSRLAALGQGAERADKRFQGAIGAGTDIAGLLERRELARAGELGTLDGQRTLSGQDQDQALMGTIISLLQSEFNPNSTKDKQQQALARSLLPLLPPHIRAAFQEILGGA